MSLGPVPLQLDITAKGGATNSPWVAWLESLYRVVAPLGTNGTTAQRPIGTQQLPLYIGQPYFDSTLGYPVFVKSLNPTVWVNGAGAVV
jgi:hypothetical protein